MYWHVSMRRSCPLTEEKDVNIDNIFKYLFHTHLHIPHLTQSKAIWLQQTIKPVISVGIKLIFLINCVNPRMLRSLTQVFISTDKHRDFRTGKPASHSMILLYSYIHFGFQCISLMDFWVSAMIPYNRVTRAFVVSEGFIIETRR